MKTLKAMTAIGLLMFFPLLATIGLVGCQDQGCVVTEEVTVADCWRAARAQERARGH